jgi:small neutral amino acid transporter SnatA (MarC family)
MSPSFIKISKDFATIWTTIDPIGNVAIFAGLTASLTRAERRRTALRATVYATVILVVAVVADSSFSTPSAFTCTRSKLQAGSSFFSSVCKCSSDDWMRR